MASREYPGRHNVSPSRTLPPEPVDIDESKISESSSDPAEKADNHEAT